MQVAQGDEISGAHQDRHQILRRRVPQLDQVKISSVRPDFFQQFVCLHRANEIHFWHFSNWDVDHEGISREPAQNRAVHQDHRWRDGGPVRRDLGCVLGRAKNNPKQDNNKRACEKIFHNSNSIRCVTNHSPLARGYVVYKQKFWKRFDHTSTSAWVSAAVILSRDGQHVGFFSWDAVNADAPV